MTKLLFIEASPRGGESKSIQIAETYLSVLLANNPDLDVDRLKLWEADLPAFDGDKVAAKMNVIVGQEQNAAQKTAWDQIVEIANRFIAADRYLFAVPMWNGGIPYRLKHYIDLIHQPGLLWGQGLVVVGCHVVSPDADLFHAITSIEPRRLRCGSLPRPARLSHRRFADDRRGTFSASARSGSPCP